MLLAINLTSTSISLLPPLYRNFRSCITLKQRGLYFNPPGFRPHRGIGAAAQPIQSDHDLILQCTGKSSFYMTRSNSLPDNSFDNVPQSMATNGWLATFAHVVNRSCNDFFCLYRFLRTVSRCSWCQLQFLLAHTRLLPLVIALQRIRHRRRAPTSLSGSRESDLAFAYCSPNVRWQASASGWSGWRRRSIGYKGLG